MKMKARLKIIALIPLFLSLIIILAVFWAKRDMKASRELDRAADQIVENAFELHVITDQYLLYPGERPKIQFRSIHHSMKRSLATIKTKTDEEEALLKDIRQHHESMGSLFELLVSMYERPTAVPSPELRETARSQLLASSREIVSGSFQLSKLSLARIDEVQGGVIVFLLIIALISGIGLASFSFLMGRRIERTNEDLQREITERQRAEETLQQRTLELHHLAETLEERVKERTVELANLSSRLVSAQEDERRRVSYDLHDNAWQALVAIRFEIERLFSERDGTNWVALQDKSKKVMAALLETVGKIRSMQGDLWPYVLDDIGILATIDWYCREFEKNHAGLTIERPESLAEHEIPSSAKIVIYRILQETLSNVVKHSRASRVTLRLRKKDQRIEFIIDDNGLGFDLQETLVKRSPWGGLGLLNLKARTELSGGFFGVESVTGQGTTVRASWPI